MDGWTEMEDRDGIGLDGFDRLYDTTGLVCIILHDYPT
jgi:hypothetical protein